MTERAIYYALKREPAKEWLGAYIAAALQLGQIPAMKTMLSLLSSSNEMSKYRSAAWLMRANGVGPMETRNSVSINVNGDVKAGYVILLSEPQQVGDACPSAHAGPVIDHREDEERWPVVPGGLLVDGRCCCWIDWSGSSLLAGSPPVRAQGPGGQNAGTRPEAASQHHRLPVR